MYSKNVQIRELMGDVRLLVQFFQQPAGLNNKQIRTCYSANINKNAVT